MLQKNALTVNGYIFYYLVADGKFIVIDNRFTFLGTPFCVYVLNNKGIH